MNHFNYDDQPKIRMDRCPLCDGEKISLFVKKDRYGFDATFYFCHNCGLYFVNPIMTQDAYFKFYRDNIYRKILFERKFAKKAHKVNKYFKKDDVKYAKMLVDFLSPHIQKHKTSIDIGGSTGHVVSVVKETFEMDMCVLDPNVKELNIAKDRGLDVINDVFENHEFKNKFDLILLCKTIDHVVSIPKTMNKVRDIMSNKGLFFFDACDIMSVLKINGYIRQRVFKVDHPYAFSQPSLRYMLAKFGFEAIGKKKFGYKVGFICKKSIPFVIDVREDVKKMCKKNKIRLGCG